MFTGIIQAISTIQQVQKRKENLRLTVAAKRKLPGIELGESIALNGVCLTVSSFTGSKLSFDVVPETLRMSSLGELRKGNAVNLERSLKLGERLGGHYVLGHVEATGRLVKIEKTPKEICFWISLPKKLKDFVIPKGCIAVDGISLTVGEVKKDAFAVYLIPHTLRVTNLKNRKTRDTVNLETDILYKAHLAKNRSGENARLSAGSLF